MDNNTNIQSLIEEFENSQDWNKSYYRDFPQLDTLVDGVALKQEEGAPYVADTTLSGLVRALPRFALQQLPVFSMEVNGSTSSLEAVMSSYMLRRIVFNEDTFGKGLLSTMRIIARRSITRGYMPVLFSAESLDGDFGTRMKPLHYVDVAIEKGVRDANESGFYDVRVRIMPSRLDRLIKSVEKKNGDTQWDLEALKSLREVGASASDLKKWQSDVTKSTFQDVDSYEIVTRYETGKDGKFVTFSPQYPDKPLKVVKNNSKFGYPRVQFLVIDPSDVIPFGESRVRLASPLQNLLNAYYQNVASMFMINSAPPISVFGIPTSPITYRPNVKWEFADFNSKVVVNEMSNSSLAQFNDICSQLSAQIQNIIGSPTGTVNGGTNSMGYSKTAPGVKMQQNAQDATTNEVSTILENFLRQYAVSALDVYVSERAAQNVEEDVIVDDEAKEALNRLEEDYVGDDNVVKINWNKFYENITHWTAKIDVGVSKDELDDKKRADSQDMLETMSRVAGDNPEMQAKMNAITDKLVKDTIPESKQIDAVVARQPEMAQPNPLAAAPVPETPQQ